MEKFKMCKEDKCKEQGSIIYSNDHRERFARLCRKYEGIVNEMMADDDIIAITRNCANRDETQIQYTDILKSNLFSNAEDGGEFYPRDSDEFPWEYVIYFQGMRCFSLYDKRKGSLQYAATQPEFKRRRKR